MVKHADIKTKNVETAETIFVSACFTTSGFQTTSIYRFQIIQIPQERRPAKLLGCERAGPYAAPNLRKRERLDRETEAGMAQVFTALATNQLHFL